MPRRPPTICKWPGCAETVAKYQLCVYHRLQRLVGTANRPEYADGERIKAVVICGPPGAGKSSYVAELKERNDLVLDVDMLYRAFTLIEERDKPEALLPFVCAARDAALRRVMQGSGEVETVWIITSSSDFELMKALIELLGGELVMLPVEPEECRRRMVEQGRTDEHIVEVMPVVEEWWREYQGGRAESLRGSANV